MSAQSITFYRHYICFAENLSVAVVVNANILIIRRFKMGVTEKTAILVISFGTSYEETRKKTIEQIESDLHHAFPEYPLYLSLIHI